MRSAFFRDAEGLYVVQRAGEILDYGFDHVDAVPAGDSITSSVWAAEGCTLSAPELDGTVSTVFVTGGVAGTVARVTNTINTAGGRRKIEDVRIFLK